MALAPSVMIFANRLSLLGLRCEGPYAALADRHVVALVACLQLTIQSEFDAQPLAAHPRLHLRTLDLITVSGEGKRIVVADHSLFDVTQNRRQRELWCQRPMVVGEVGHGPREVRVPFRPIFL